MKILHGHTARFYFCAGAAAVLLLPEWLVWTAALLTVWFWWRCRRHQPGILPEFQES